MTSATKKTETQYINGMKIFYDAPEFDPKGIKVGDAVRSFDFSPRNREVEGKHACFREGIVLSFAEARDGTIRYRVWTIREVFKGEEMDIHLRARIVYPPVNGTPTWTDETDGVDLLDGLGIDGEDLLTLKTKATTLEVLWAREAFLEKCKDITF